MLKMEVVRGGRYAYVKENDPFNGAPYARRGYDRSYGDAAQVECVALKSSVKGGVRVRFIETGEERDVPCDALHLEWHAHLAHVTRMRKGEDFERQLTIELWQAAARILGVEVPEDISTAEYRFQADNVYGEPLRAVLQELGIEAPQSAPFQVHTDLIYDEPVKVELSPELTAALLRRAAEAPGDPEDPRSPRGAASALDALLS